MGLPTARGVEHLSITVGDLDQATRFFRDVFGCPVLYTMGPFDGRAGPFMRVIANADVRSVVHHVRVLRSPRLNIELFEVTTPRQCPLWPDLLHIGGWGLVALVDDLPAARTFLDSCDLYQLGDDCYLTAFGLHFEVRQADAASPAPPLDGGPMPGGLPGFRGFDRMRVTVADLDEATEFLDKVVGLTRVGDVEPWEQGGPEGGLRAFANVDARARPSRAGLLAAPDIGVELIECPPYWGQSRDWPAMFDVGGWHLAFYVDDMDAAFDHLLSCDVHILGRKKPAYHYEAGDEAYTVHCLAPFGFYFELVTYPSGRYLAHEHAAPAWLPGAR